MGLAEGALIWARAGYSESVLHSGTRLPWTRCRASPVRSPPAVPGTAGERRFRALQTADHVKSWMAIDASSLASGVHFVKARPATGEVGQRSGCRPQRCSRGSLTHPCAQPRTAAMLMVPARTAKCMAFCQIDAKEATGSLLTLGGFSVSYSYRGIALL